MGRFDQRLEWNFEPCDPEGAQDARGRYYPHAVRGRREGGRLVHGYGHTPPEADHDARDKAQQFDAHEMLGERGEAIASAGLGHIL